MGVVYDGGAKLDPGRRYVFGYAPHGLFPIGAPASTAADIASSVPARRLLPQEAPVPALRMLPQETLCSRLALYNLHDTLPAGLTSLQYPSATPWGRARADLHLLGMHACMRERMCRRMCVRMLLTHAPLVLMPPTAPHLPQLPQFRALFRGACMSAKVLTGCAC